VTGVQTCALPIYLRAVQLRVAQARDLHQVVERQPGARPPLLSAVAAKTQLPRVPAAPPCVAPLLCPVGEQPVRHFFQPVLVVGGAAELEPALLGAAGGGPWHSPGAPESGAVP